MEANEYQKKCAATNKYQSDEELVCLTMGLASEAGEVAGKVDEWIRKKHNTNPSAEYRYEIIKELGDVMWFTACLAAKMGATLDVVMQLNLEKLADREKRNEIADLKGGDNR